MSFTLKIRPKPYAQAANRLLHALAQMDLSQAEAALMFSALPFTTTADKERDEWGIVQVKRGPWLAAQRDKSAAYKALARLIERGVIWQNSKGRHFLENDLAKWRDKNGRAVFFVGSKALDRVRKLDEIHPYWGAKTDNEKGDAHPLSRSGDDEAKGTHVPQKVDTEPPKGGRTSTREVDTRPPEAAANPPAERESGPPRKQQQEREKNNASNGLSSILEYGIRFAKLLEGDHGQLSGLASKFGRDRIVSALEVLATTSGEKRNPIGYLRTLAKNDARRDQMPPDVPRYEDWIAQEAAKQRAQKQRVNTGDASSEGAKSPRRQPYSDEQLMAAIRWSQRDERQRAATLDKLRRAREHGPARHWAEQWAEADCPPVRDWLDGIAVPAFATLEATFRQFLAPVFSESGGEN